MAHIINENAIIDGVRFKEQAANPEPPTTGFRLLFVKNNGVYDENSAGTVTGPLGSGGGNSLEVKEVDGNPDVSNVSIIRVTNGTLTDDGAGQVTINTGGGVTDGDKGDIVVSSSGTVWTIDNGVVTFSKMQAITDGKLLGASGGTAVEEINVSTGLQLSGNNLSSTITQYTDEQAQDAVGAMVDGTLAYIDATPLLTRAALTGDVTAPQASNATTIANDAVTYAKMQNVSAASRLLGRGSASGSGDVQEIDLGSGLSLSGTTLSGNGGGLVLNVNTTPVGNVGGGEDNLITYTVPANTLDTNGQFIQFEMVGIFGASLNTKEIKVYFGSAVLLDTGALAITAAGNWSIRGIIIRTGASTQRCICAVITDESALNASSKYVDATEDLTGTVVLKATGQGTADNDIVQKFQTVVKGGGSSGGGSGAYPQQATIWGDESATVSGNDLTIVRDTSQNYNGYAQQFPTAANGDAWSWTFFIKAGTYTFNVYGVIGTALAIVDWTLDGSAIVTGQDWYNGSYVYNTVKAVGSISVATDGQHTLRATVNGKNGSSTGFYVEFTKMWFK